MQISERGICRLKQFEGCVKINNRHVIYDDATGKPVPVGVPLPVGATIGYGHLIKPGEDFSAGLTEQQATELLEQDLQATYNTINEQISADAISNMTQSQYDALVSLVFNIGAGSAAPQNRNRGLYQSTVRKYLNDNKYKSNIYPNSTFQISIHEKRTVAFSMQQSFVLDTGQLLLSVNGALTAILALALELDSTVNQSEQGVILADTNVDTGMDVGASLANQNVAGQNELTVCTLDAQALSLGVTAVLGGTAALVVSEELNTNFQHGVTPPKLRYNQDIDPADPRDRASVRQALPG